MTGQGRMIYRLLLGTLGLVLVTVVLIGGMWLKLSSVENKSCEIQRRGLPANHELVLVMGFAYRLFTDPPSAGERQQRPTRRQAGDLLGLELHLGRYTALEAQQPRTRVC